MPWSQPTLGWGVLEWMATYLPSPRDPEQPFVLTDEQAEFVLAWYAVDTQGRFVYRRSISERAKGWGKSPLHGAIALAELGAAKEADSAPVIFDGWVGKEPVGRPWGTRGAPRPWVQIAAVSEDQTDNTYSALYEMLTANDHRAAKALGIDDGRTRLYLTGRPGTLEPVTASAGSREGQPITHGLLDETHLYTPSNGGTKLAATIRRNVAKMGGRSQETTNAPLLGTKSVAEASGNQAGRHAGILWDCKRPKIEPDPKWSDEQMLAALRDAYGDAYWVDLNRILADVRDPSTEWSDALRFFFNIRNAGQGRAVDPRVWDDLAAPHDVPQGTRIGLGFDGSVSRDATVLRGCTADGYSFIIKTWVRPQGATDWRVDRADVYSEVQRAFDYYDVGLMLVDPFYWRSDMEQWSDKFCVIDRITFKRTERVLEFDTNQTRRFAIAIDRWLTAIREGSHTHDADPLTDLHVKAAHLRKVRLADDDDDGRTKYVLVKGDDHGRIDGAVADVLAYEAAMTMPPAEPPKGTPAFISFDD